MSINDYLIKTKFAAISRRVWVLNEPENELECGGVMSINDYLIQNETILQQTHALDRRGKGQEAMECLFTRAHLLLQDRQYVECDNLIQGWTTRVGENRFPSEGFRRIYPEGTIIPTYISDNGLTVFSTAEEALGSVRPGLVIFGLVVARTDLTRPSDEDMRIVRDAFEMHHATEMAIDVNLNQRGLAVGERVNSDRRAIITIGLLRACFAARHKLPSWEPLLTRVTMTLGSDSRLLQGLVHREKP